MTIFKNKLLFQRNAHFIIPFIVRYFVMDVYDFAIILLFNNLKYHGKMSISSVNIVNTL